MSSHEAGSSEGIRLLEGSKCVYQCKAKRKREIRRGGEAPLRAPEGREFPSPAADHHPEGREDESASFNARGRESLGSCRHQISTRQNLRLAQAVCDLVL